MFFYHYLLGLLARTRNLIPVLPCDSRGVAVIGSVAVCVVQYRRRRRSASAAATEEEASSPFFSSLPKPSRRRPGRQPSQHRYCTRRTNQVGPVNNIYGEIYRHFSYFNSANLFHANAKKLCLTLILAKIR